MLLCRWSVLLNTAQNAGNDRLAGSNAASGNGVMSAAEGESIVFASSSFAFGVCDSASCWHVLSATCMTCINDSTLCVGSCSLCASKCSTSAILTSPFFDASIEVNMPLKEGDISFRSRWSCSSEAATEEDSLERSAPLRAFASSSMVRPRGLINSITLRWAELRAFTRCIKA